MDAHDSFWANNTIFGLSETAANGGVYSVQSNWREDRKLHTGGGYLHQ